jgi:ABC-type microcin C transport system duplicated ATPase subunit YejF
MIRLKNVVASYRTGRGSINAVDGVSLEVPDGCILGVAGESGCGKSTLMKLIYGDVQLPMALSSGSIEYGFVDDRGSPITSDNVRDYWFKRISYIPQSSMNSLNPVVRVGKQFVDFPGSEPDKKRVMEKVRGYITKLGLPVETLDAYPHQLSGGMRQRVMIAMATFFQPDLILARARRGSAEGHPDAAHGVAGADGQHHPARLPRHGRALSGHHTHAHHVRRQGGRIWRFRKRFPGAAPSLYPHAHRLAPHHR